MKINVRNIFFLIVVLFIMILSIFGPEALANYKDRNILNQAHTETVEIAGEGYRYQLSSNEKLYILSKCLNSQTLPESDYNALTKNGITDIDYSELEGTYAFVVNHKGPSGKEITDEEIYETTNGSINTLKELGILPETVKPVAASSYDAVLYSAIDVLEPQNNVAVWKVSLSSIQTNFNKGNRVIDAYIDADDGKIYEFYARTDLSWADIDVDQLVEKWSKYMGLSQPVPYESANPLMETATYFKKYEFTGMGDDKTIVTIGFYDSINELFLRISK